jgi:RNA polymerase sigma factor (sigma-70 family)
VVQATFLALARNAARLGQSASLINWLYTVAVRQSRTARTRFARQRNLRTLLPIPTAAPDPLTEVSGRELMTIIDDELARLPERYRLPLVLCALEGLSRDEAAVRLGWTLGTIRGRLERGRELLRTRLAKRGLTVPAVLTGGLLVPPADAMQAALVRAVTRAAMAMPPAAMPAKLLVVAAVVLTALGIGTGFAMMPSGQPGPKANPPAPMAVGPGVPRPPVDAEGVPLPPGVVARLGSTRFRHAGSVYRVEFAPDGKSLMTTAPGGTRLWDAGTGRLVRHLLEAGLFGRWPCFSPDGRELRIIVDGKPGSFVRRDVATGRELLRVRLADERPYVTAATLDGRRFAVGWMDKSVRIYSATDGREAFRFTVEGAGVRSLDFSPDGRRLAVADFRNVISFFDASTGRPTGELKRDGVTYTFVTHSPDGRSLAALAIENGQPIESVIDLFDVPAGRHLRRISGWDMLSARHLVFSPDCSLLAVASQRPDVVLWDPATGREVRRLRTYPSVLATAFSPDGKTLAAASGAGTISLWDVASGKLCPASADPIIGLYQLRFTDGGRLLIGTSERRITWDVASGREVARSAEKASGYGLPVLSPDGRLVAALTDPRDANQELILSDAATGEQIRTIPGRFNLRPYPTFTPDGRRIIVGDTEYAIRIFDVATGQPSATLMGHGSRIDWLAVSPDSRSLASPSRDGDSIVRLWDLTTCKETRQFKCRLGSVNAAAFSPDGRRLVTICGERNRPGDRSEVQLWDMASGREQRSFAGHAGWATVLAFAPDGRTFITGGYGVPLRLWEVTSGGERYLFTGHSGTIDSVAVSPDGSTLAASSSDAPIYLWDIYGRSDPQQPPTADELNQCWTDLAATDAAVAFRSIRRLIAAPDAALALLRDKLKTLSPTDAERVKQLIANLDSPKFADRQAAAKELDAVADRTADQLRATLTATKSAEARQALQTILDHLDAATPEVLRVLRSVEVLEQFGTKAARDQLKTLAGGAAGAILTKAAADAVKRMEPALAGR